MNSMSYHFIIRNLAIFSLWICQVQCFAQSSVLSLGLPNGQYESIIDNAKDQNKPSLLLIYHSSYLYNQNEEFSHLKEILYRDDITLGLININQDPTIFQLLESLYVEADQLLGMVWVLMHPDEIQIKYAHTINNDAQAHEFLQSGMNQYKNFQEVYLEKNNSKQPEDLFNLSKQASLLADQDYCIKVFNKYLKSLDWKRINKKTSDRIIEIGRACPEAKQFNKLLNKKEELFTHTLPQREIAELKYKYAISDLEDKQLLEPYYVWKRFEKDMGYYADSLYRIFAIDYFTRNKEADILYNEAFEYLELYPRTNWSYLRPLYAKIILATDEKSDLELLLDLISFQIFREHTFDKIDFRAAILYKLGEKDKALKLVQEANSLALKEGIRYKSLLNVIRVNID